MKDMFAQGGSGSVGIKTNKQAIARSYNIKTSEVIYSNDRLSTLDDKVALYDKSTQFVWAVPDSLPSGATIVSVTGSTLVYNPGAVSVTMYVLRGPDVVQLRSDLLSDTGTTLVKYKSTLSGAVSRTLREKLAEAISVTDFGAKGDGTTDDTAAFTAALEAAYRSGSKGASVYVPASNAAYVVNGLIITSGVRLFSDGKYGATIKTTTGSSITIRARFVQIDGLNFEGAGKSAGNTVGIRIEEALVTVVNNAFAFFDTAFMSRKGFSAAELIVQNNRFASCNYGVFLEGGQINSHFLNNTYSDNNTHIHVSEDLSLGVSGTTEGLLFQGEMLYSGGDDSVSRRAIEVTGTRWTWFDHCMSDLAKGIALFLEDAVNVHVDGGYYSSNNSTGSACIKAVGACDNLVINSTDISDSRFFGLHIEDKAGVAPKNVRIIGATFQNNDLDSAQQGDFLLNSVANVIADTCHFSSVKAGAITLLGNDLACSLHLRNTTHAGGVNLTASNCKITLQGSPTHPSSQSGVAIIPNGLTFVNVALTVNLLVSSATVVPIASAIGTAAEPISAVLNGDGTFRISRVGTTGDLSVGYMIQVAY